MAQMFISCLETHTCGFVIKKQRIVHIPSLVFSQKCILKILKNKCLKNIITDLRLSFTFLDILLSQIFIPLILYTEKEMTHFLNEFLLLNEIRSISRSLNSI